MKAAVIDLGTNTFHLIIASISAVSVEVLFKTNVPVRLGQGRINEGIIIPEAFARGIQTLKDFKSEIEKNKVTIVKAIATSAIRSAGNGADFVNAAREQAGIDIEVISGDEEAAYIFNGVKATGLLSETALIMDIGGGSTEFIIGNSEGLLWKKSYDIGAARLMQAYFNSDPINLQDKGAIIQHLNATLGDLQTACGEYKPSRLIGSAGAFETFAVLLNGSLDVQQIRHTPIDFKAYQELSEQLIASTHAEREQMPNLIELRVDMIVIAAILTDYIITLAGIKQMSLSTYDLKMGVLYTLSGSKVN